jgi:MoaA/NifB/PqqE/SkfB family radical SAM enzyme
MNTKQVKQAMNEFSEAGTIFWTFTGGEPLVRKDIGKLVNHARKLFPIVTLTTNGLLLKQKIGEVKDVNYFTISLDGSKEVTDRFRGKGTFDKAIEGIRAARERGIDVVINAVISKANTQNNCEGIRNLIEIAQTLDCKLNFSAIYSDQFNQGFAKKTFPTSKEQKKALDLIKEFKKEKFSFIMFSNPCIEHLKNPKIWKPCYAGKLFCDLFPDGTVLPCLFKEKQGINGLKHGFVEAFNSLPENKNCTCPSTCYNELNCIFSLNSEAMVENFLKYIAFIGR